MLARSLIVTIGAVLGAAAIVPEIATRYLETANGTTPSQTKNTVVARAETPRYAGNRDTVLDADRNGHFSGAFLLNGRKVDGMVDTGASTVAINVSTAQRIGIARSTLDFRYAVDTANGKARAAYVKLDRVEVGAIRVEGVDAIVLDDQALSGTLIGMSFLQALSSYRVEDGKLRLTR